MAAGVITVSLVAPTAMNAANVSMEDGQSVTTEQRAGGSGIFDTGTPDASNPNGNGDSTTAGPKISVKKDKFLVLKGDKFDFETELGLKIVDETEGDITSQLKVPAIETSKAGTIKKTVKAVNSKGEVSTLDIVINIVDVVESADIKDKSELDKFDLSKLINGDTSGLTLAVKSVAEDGKSFVLTITDGTNAIEKTVTMTGTGSATGEETGKEEGTDQGTTENPGTEETDKEQPGEESTEQGGTQAGGTTGGGGASLPQTGAVATGIGGIGGLTALAAFLKFKRK